MPNWLVRKYTKKKMKLARRHVLPAMDRMQAEGVWFDWLAQVLLNTAFPDYHIYPLASHADCARPLAEIYPGCVSQTRGPKRLSEVPAPHLSPFPAIRAYGFSDVIVSAKASALRKGNRTSLPAYYVNRPDATIADGSFLVSDVPGKGLLREPQPALPISRGIAVFGSGALNWYHWLIEILPAASFARALPAGLQDHPLLVPQECLDMPNFRDALMAVAGPREVIPLQADQIYHVNDLVVIDPAAHGPMNMRRGQWPRLSDYAQNATALRDHRQIILNSLALPPAPADRRLFLARSNERRSYNQEELLDIAAGFGIEPVYPEQMSFRDQVALYQRAQILIGPSGAAFANTLFCQPGARALTWILPHYNQFCVYSNMADVVGLDLNYLFVTPDRPINSSHDAYIATYTVDPETFRRTLGDLLATT